MDTYKIWNGSIDLFLDKINVENYSDFVIGNFGGSTENGASFNEDGLLCFFGSDWRLAVLMDAHTTSESLLLLTRVLEEKLSYLNEICNKDISVAIPQLNNYLIALITDEKLLKESQQVNGETAVLFCFEKKGYLYWLSVGDNSLYLLQKDFNTLGQFRLNQRVFFQWFGLQNSLSLSVPCYSSGTIQLREDEATIIMLTDGVLEIEGRPYENEKLLASEFTNSELNKSVSTILNTVRDKKGYDSATIVTWKTRGVCGGLVPSRL